MRSAMVVAALGAAIGGFSADAHAGMALGVDSITSDVSHALSASGEGSGTVSLAGGLGPVAGGADVEFSVSFSLDFAGSAGPGDGVVSFLSLAPVYATGALEVVAFTINADLYDTGAFVTHIATPPGGSAQSLPSGATTMVGSAAFSFARDGFGAFEHIGDAGDIEATLSFRWSGSQPGDAMTVGFVPISEISYAPFVPAPGAACVLGLALMRLCRARRGG